MLYPGSLLCLVSGVHSGLYSMVNSEPISLGDTSLLKILDVCEGIDTPPKGTPILDFLDHLASEWDLIAHRTIFHRVHDTAILLVGINESES